MLMPFIRQVFTKPYELLKAEMLSISTEATMEKLYTSNLKIMEAFENDAQGAVDVHFLFNTN